MVIVPQRKLERVTLVEGEIQFGIELEHSEITKLEDHGGLQT
jgi:hypothetical protein